ncbi:MAG: tagatose-bisphosphate aldolase [Sulfobacillus acidophilus]|uniref:Tagatose-bisphosphate aldolase n=1 Tax=Sulfobacillus acidophilus TaxID=53633 RepID=A0A2T2WI27_9FIRM|nr:MAG: tagatose-bisphosphate aldolase [Sulfobacillus acidophilus]
MIGNPHELIRDAQKRKAAVPAFNIDSIDMAMGVIEAGQWLDRGFIMQVTVETLDIWGWEFFSEAITHLISRAHVPIALLLDHAKRVDDIRRAIDLGYPAVMYDGSALPLTDNIATTREVVHYAREHGCFVEGEVGHVARDGEPAHWEHLTSVEEAQTYWEAAGVDALAVAVGSKHGHYRTPEDINVERVHEIFEVIQAPLVLHGGSGMPVELFSQLIRRGIAKVNIGTELRRAWWSGIDGAEHAKPREALRAARAHVKTRSIEIMRTLSPAPNQP